MKVGIVQYRPEVGHPDHNRAAAINAVERLAEQGAELVVLPELFTVGYFAFDEYEASAEPFEGPTVHALSSVARRQGVAVLTGTFVEDLSRTTSIETPAPTGLANTAALIDGNGDVVAHYRKHHLFGYQSEEANRLVPGDTLGVAELGDHVVGITTCYDLRFPGLYRRYLEEDVTLMLVPSAWPDARPTHWETLIRARAIENQWFLAAVNGAGDVAGTTLLGRSALLDPWGDAVVELGTEPESGVGEADPAVVREIRDDFPVLADRRAD